MGLSVYAYGGLTKVEDGSLPKDITDEPSRYGFVRIYKTEFDRAPELEDHGLYRPRETHHFSAGSYGGYNDWRDLLARMVGYESARAAWKAKKPGPFVELINFSDCEGTIGASVSAKLAHDFVDWRERAEVFAESTGGEGGTWFVVLYDRFKRAFEVASADGVVVFR